MAEEEAQSGTNMDQFLNVGDSGMDQFLKDRRINIGDISAQAKADGTETAAERAKRQREFAIQKRVSKNDTANLFSLIRLSRAPNSVPKTSSILRFKRTTLS